MASDREGIPFSITSSISMLLYSRKETILMQKMGLGWVQDGGEGWWIELSKLIKNFSQILESMKDWINILYQFIDQCNSELHNKN